jgi:hypothetical protein
MRVEIPVMFLFGVMACQPSEQMICDPPDNPPVTIRLVNAETGQPIGPHGGEVRVAADTEPLSPVPVVVGPIYRQPANVVVDTSYDWIRRGEGTFRVSVSWPGYRPWDTADVVVARHGSGACRPAHGVTIVARLHPCGTTARC